MTIHSSSPRLPILSSPATEGSLVQRLIGSRGGRALKPRGHQILVRGPCGSGAGLPDPTGGRATADFPLPGNITESGELRHFGAYNSLESGEFAFQAGLLGDTSGKW